MKPKDTRSSLTRKLHLAPYDLYLVVSFYENKQPCEIFVKIAKEGTTISGLLDMCAVQASLLLQSGMPWAELKKRWVYTRFEPSDDKYSSILDMLAVEITNLIILQGGNEEKGSELK